MKPFQSVQAQVAEMNAAPDNWEALYHQTPEDQRAELLEALQSPYGEVTVPPVSIHYTIEPGPSVKIEARLLGVNAPIIRLTRGERTGQYRFADRQMFSNVEVFFEWKDSGMVAAEIRAQFLNQKFPPRTVVLCYV